MAQYTFLTKADIQSILIPYGIKNVLSYKVLSGGWVNSNYKVQTLTQDFVLTISEQKSIQKATALAFFLVYLDQHSFTTSKIVKTLKGELTTVWDQKPVLLKEYIEGDIIEDLSENQLTYLGGELAKLHGIEPPDYLPKGVSYGMEHFDDVKVYAPHSSFYTWLKALRKHIEDLISSELPRSLVHGDIFFNNVIVSKDGERVTIMDFEDACQYYRIFDIGMMLIGTCSEGESLSLHKARHLLKGYQQKIKLLDIEIIALQAFTAYGAAATAFWRHQNFNYVHVDAGMKGHYLALKNLADNVMNIHSDQFRTIFG
ncbi:MAG: phosphotransferase [Maribacter sp.]|nr:phosphotransferase [Maribacter sp.]